MRDIKIHPRWTFIFLSFCVSYIPKDIESILWFFFQWLSGRSLKKKIWKISLINKNRLDVYRKSSNANGFDQ